MNTQSNVEPICKHCGCKEYVKAGIHHKKQRYQCNNCKHRYVIGNNREYPEFMKLRAIELLLVKMSIRSIARELNVSPGTIINWINKFKKDHKIDNKIDKDIDISNVKSVEIDEMYHYYQSKKK